MLSAVWCYFVSLYADPRAVLSSSKAVRVFLVTSCTAFLNLDIEPALLSWSEGTAPYYLSVYPGMISLLMSPERRFTLFARGTVHWCCEITLLP